MNRPLSIRESLADLLATDERSSPFDVETDAAGNATSVPAERAGQSLFGEVLDFMLAPLLLLWPISIIVTLFIARSLADAPYDQALRERAILLGQQIQFIEGPGGRRAAHVPGATHGLLARETRNLLYDVRDGGGRPVFGNAQLPVPTQYEPSKRGVVQFRTIAYNETDLRVAYTYVAARDDVFTGRPALVQVAEHFEQRRELASRIIRGVIFPQFVILPLAAALVWFGLARGLQPLRGLGDRIRGRRPDDMSPIDASRAPQEIRPLLESFNHLLDRLGSTMQAQKRFIADAAHQIKTPLAGIQMQAELAHRAGNDEERLRSLEQLARSSARASHLVNQLLALARAENSGGIVPFEVVDLSALARECLTELAPLAIEAGLDIGFEADERPTRIRGNPLLLGELINNLVSNAIRYTPRHGGITLRVHSALSMVNLEIEDNGPGIPAAEREAVFERFYRVRDRLASNEGEARGSGLGLAIVREIAGLHRARIRIEEGSPWPAERGHGDGRGTRVVVRFDEYRERLGVF
ncbi:MAG: sensor histidine kinase N-terminal domain-containing protein [Burkholderiaceae bacterium]